MIAIHSGEENGPRAVRTTLLALVRSLTRQGHPPDEVVRIVREGLESGRYVLTGNFRKGLFSVSGSEDQASDPSDSAAGASRAPAGSSKTEPES